jgi:hypothetical protein
MNARSARLKVLVLLSICAMAPSVALAQQQPPVQGTPQAPQQQQGPCAPRAAITPTEQQLYRRMMHRLAPANLTPPQQAQIGTLIAQYSQAHPAGSPLVRPAMRQLRESIMALLTPQQLQALQAARETQGAPNARHCQPSG